MPELVMEEACEPIQLEPFVHQVSGHSSMMCFDEHTICKPLNSREHHFYETMPSAVREFTPQYRGVIEVAVHEDSDGYMNLMAYPTESKKKKRVLSPSSSPSSSGEGAQSDSESKSPEALRARNRFRIRRSGSIEVLGGRDQKFEVVDSDSCDTDTSTAGHNPWSIRCHKEQLAKMLETSKGKNSHKFILLENLASHFKMPCILDLKMGTRQHGDDATEEKRQIQIRKCANTTSSSLGFRICGMQVYQADVGHYMCHDKYYGRRLKAEGLPGALHQFLHNGYKMRANLIDPIVDRLRQLHAMITKQKTFRFYSSSLLIMYEGADWDLFDSTLEMDNWSSVSADRDKEDNSRNSEQTAGASASGSSKGPCNWDGLKNARANSRDKNNKFVLDVRMIDFAHATHQAFRGDRTVHTGPDKGYLFGLENLIRMFEDTKSRYAK